MKKKKKLIIVHSKKNIIIDDQNIFYVNLGESYVKASNCKKILLSKYYKKYYNFYKKQLVLSLKKKILKTRNLLPFVFELEIFNLRNDKIKNIDLIINILILKKIIKKFKFQDISLISDNPLTQKILYEIYPKIKNNNKIVNFNKNFLFLKLSKFYIKIFFLLILIKIFKAPTILKNTYKNVCISLAPTFYKNGVENFFKKKENLKLNFLITDETHLNLSLINAFRTFKNKYKNLIHVESFIEFNDLFFGLIKSYKYLFNTKKIDMNFSIENNNLSKFYEEYFLISLLNRLKLIIYDNAFLKTFKKFKVKNFEMYLFEYCFGFYLINLIRKNLENIRITGYQHGIFSDKLFWFELLATDKIKRQYLPDDIISFNRQSLKDYKKIIKSRKIKYKLVKKNASEISVSFKNIKKIHLNKHFLILPGTHDAEAIYENFKNKDLNNKISREIFYFKFHPKKKINGINSKNLKFITSIKNKKFHSALLSSTSTLVYDFINLKKNFMVYDIDNKQNLISSSLQNKVKFYKI
ncbi:hypothetical protein IDG58_01765 [Pelagibacterales bacterium SAG-MED19]|nr:hypothetical protein [Pelagibacterales bacterium SAG-MED19]